jgi:hypothetical protein
MKSRRPGESDESLSDRGKLSLRAQQPPGEEAKPVDDDEGEAESSRRQMPRDGRPTERDEEGVDGPSTQRAPWLPPARR